MDFSGTNLTPVNPTDYPQLDFISKTFVDSAGEVNETSGTTGESGGAYFSGAGIDPEDSYPFKSALFNFTTGASIPDGTLGGEVVVRTSIASVRMFAKQIMLCKEERDQIRNIPTGLPYRIKMSQSVRSPLPTTGTEVTIDLDSFSLYASYLLISMDMSRNQIVRDMELKLNSSSFSGSLPASMLINNMSEHLGIHTSPTVVSSHVTYETKFHYIEGGETQNEHYGETPMMVFPLASTAFSGSAVPLNRFDSIRLTIRFTGTPASSGNYAFSGKTSGITVTCVGETTVLYRGGAATLAMY